jgi:hypothetical protein
MKPMPRDGREDREAKPREALGKGKKSLLNPVYRC